MSLSEHRTIDKIDLENDFLRLVKKNKNPFPVDVFPKVLQEVIFESNDKYQFSIDYLGAGILSAVSASIGNSLKVEVKKGWIEKANLFTVIVGRPGDSKSHALNFCFKPIHIKENQMYSEYSQLLEAYENDAESSDKSKNKKPFLKKLLISDFTPEALTLHHSLNPKGLYIYVDELNGWIKNFNRYNNSGEAEVYLSLWSGTSISYERASGKCLRINDPFVGVIGSTQISVLHSFAKDGRSSNGFMDRLLFVYPEIQKTLKWNIDKVEDNILENYFSIITNMIERARELEETKVFTFEEKAKQYLFDWQNNRPDTFLFEYERSIEIKLQQYVVRFALLLHCLDQSITNEPFKPVTLKAVEGGVSLFEYFHYSAIKVRQELVKKDYYEQLTELQRSILNDLPDKFSTAGGVKIACKKVKGMPRISERQFKTYLKDKKLFKKVAHGKYEKVTL